MKEKRLGEKYASDCDFYGNKRRRCDNPLRDFQNFPVSFPDFLRNNSRAQPLAMGNFVDFLAFRQQKQGVRKAVKAVQRNPEFRLRVYLRGRAAEDKDERLGEAARRAVFAGVKSPVAAG